MSSQGQNCLWLRTTVLYLNLTKDVKYFITATLYSQSVFSHFKAFVKTWVRCNTHPQPPTPSGSCLPRPLPISLFANCNASLILPFIDSIIHSYFDAEMLVRIMSAVSNGLGDLKASCQGAFPSIDRGLLEKNTLLLHEYAWVSHSIPKLEVSSCLQNTWALRVCIHLFAVLIPRRRWADNSSWCCYRTEIQQEADTGLRIAEGLPSCFLPPLFHWE